jgi:NADH dehydrogenase
VDDHLIPRRVVIVGGGFAGLFAARELRHRPVEVTLVDRAAHHLFQPLLYQCATGVLSEGQIAVPLRSVLKRHDNVDCVLAEVTDFDVDAREVVAERPGGEEVRFPYDDLIVAAGVQQSYFGHDEFAAYAPGMKTLADALLIRRLVFGAFEMAQSATDPDERRRWLRFALVGAGPTGVELAGQIRELATLTLRDQYRRIDPGEAQVLLFDAGSVPLAPFGPKLAARAAATLTKLGVELHMGSRVTDIDQDGLVVLGPDGASTRYDARTVLWTAGVAAPPLAAALAKATGAEQDRAGRLVVRPDLTLPGHPEISVVGDLMSLDRLPGVAEVAMQTGFYAGRRIRRQVDGSAGPATAAGSAGPATAAGAAGPATAAGAAGPASPDGAAKPFRYRDVGSAAYLSRGRAVMSVGPLRISGFLGWLAWLVIHITFLTTFRNRLSALLTWTLAFGRESRRERAFTMQQIVRGRDIYTPQLPPVRPDGPPAGDRP